MNSPLVQLVTTTCFLVRLDNQKDTKPMKNVAQGTIDTFAKRTDKTVASITMAFAVGGALMEIGAHALSALFFRGSGVSLLWGMWIPLCFITIPPIHYLCRNVKNLQKRIDALESQMGERRAA